jgi:glycosyltransferase involved in cell wall biosynthesis
VRLAIGLILSPGYTPPAEFWLGRPEQAQPEGYLAVLQRIQLGQANKALSEPITGFRQITGRKFPTDVARNEVCRAVLDGNEDYLLFLDCDMVHPPDLVERLLLADKPVITARYHLKKPPFAAVVYVKHKTQDGPHRYASIHFGRGVFEVERGGAGALLIRRDVLEAIREKEGDNWFRYQRDPKAPHDFTVSEDFWFWKQARECGFSTWCDWDIECQHLAQMAVDSSWNEPFLHKQVGQYEREGVRELVLNNTIVCGYPDGMVLEDGTRIPEYQISAGER